MLIILSTIWILVVVGLVLLIIAREDKKQEDRDKFIDKLMKNR